MASESSSHFTNPLRSVESLHRAIKANEPNALMRARAVFADLRSVADGLVSADCGHQRCQHIVAIERGATSWQTLMADWKSSPATGTNSSLVPIVDHPRPIDGGITFIFGMPGCGKTVLASLCAGEATQKGRPVIWFTPLVAEAVSIKFAGQIAVVGRDLPTWRVHTFDVERPFAKRVDRSKSRSPLEPAASEFKATISELCQTAWPSRPLIVLDEFLCLADVVGQWPSDCLSLLYKQLASIGDLVVIFQGVSHIADGQALMAHEEAIASTLYGFQNARVIAMHMPGSEQRVLSVWSQLLHPGCEEIPELGGLAMGEMWSMDATSPSWQHCKLRAPRATK